jgi:hypothetical protein
MIMLPFLTSLAITTAVGALAALVRGWIEGDREVARSAVGGMAAGLAAGICMLLVQQLVLASH